MMRSARQAT